jgi:hypothetical protein
VKAYPVTDGGGARHLFWMLQRRRGRMHGRGCSGGQGKDLGGRSTAQVP